MVALTGPAASQSVRAPSRMGGNYMNTSDLPPRDLWEVARRLKHDEPLDAGDPRWVNTGPGRVLGHDRLYRSLGVDARTWTLRMDRLRHCCLFSGHRGTGKSTELRRVAAQLHGPDLFHVVFLDLLREPAGGGRLQTPDVCLALCRRLVTEMDQEGIPLQGDGTRPLTAWIRASMEPVQRCNGLHGKEPRIPDDGPGKSLEHWTALARSGAHGLGRVHNAFQRSFDGFSDAFNRMVSMARGRLKDEGRSRDLLFVLDGIDRLDGEDGRAFFAGEAHPLRRLDGVFIHCAPVQPSGRRAGSSRCLTMSSGSRR